MFAFNEKKTLFEKVEGRFVEQAKPEQEEKKLDVEEIDIADFCQSSYGRWDH